MSRAAALRACLLAALLVLAQVGMAAHAFTHLANAEKGLAASHVCEWCTAYSHLGAAAPAALLPHWPAINAADSASTGEASLVPGFPARAYRVRAPPFLS